MFAIIMSLLLGWGLFDSLMRISKEDYERKPLTPPVIVISAILQLGLLILAVREI